MEETKRTDIFGDREIALLKEMKGQMLKNVYFEMDHPSRESGIIKLGNFELRNHIFFEMSSDKPLLYLHSSWVDEPSDHDEYCSLHMEECTREKMNMQHSYVRFDEQKNPVIYKSEDYEWETFPVECRVEHIGIYRDHAKWSYNGRFWDITTDVALKISGDGFTFLFVLQDTLDMAVLVHYNYKEEDDALIARDWSRKEWGMKAENADFLERCFIEL